MRVFLGRLAKAVFSFIYSEPTESQIDSILNRAFGLQRNVSVSIKDNKFYVDGDVEGNEKVYIDNRGYLVTENMDDINLVVKDNYLYEDD